MPLSFFQESPLRQIIDLEVTIAYLDLPQEIKGKPSPKEDVLREVIVPAVFFRALEEGKWVIDIDAVQGITLDIQLWVRREVQQTVREIVGMEDRE